MSGFPIVDLIVGMIFIYFLLSIISSSAVEMILTARKYRAKVLAKWLTSIFDKDVTISNGSTVKLGQAIMDHCSVTSLSKQGKAPAYIDAKNFTSALLEKITYDHSNPKSIAKDIDGFIKAIEDTSALPNDLQRTLLAYANDAKESYKAISLKTISELDLFRSKIETWYDSNMDRVSGTLKTKYARPFTFLIAAITAISLNADSITLANYLYSNPEARASLAAKAFSAAENDSVKMKVERLRTVMKQDSTADTASVEQVTKEIKDKFDEINMAKAALTDALPMGWSRAEFRDTKGDFHWYYIPKKIAGLLVTFLAIVMGAPFWFDLLNKISNLRGSGKKPEESKAT